ncbi:uncharacterized protein PGTG_21842 [Puccinia graminis f. sp. tritici CRL 75-36-700-3]|uniref:Uncharacterized protein n=1 Tax=Puccinia graminis f. sp. tritici (strain CRL 75-36-700-3 / race SCCL) TaxID=418459 RepID=H6QSJ9_PUCGT|nr:uncharacterized protein PGTG_21842 [Puccinia graminis f. sp. tritici CRL 75-36-700-3]EHS63750.1 hypothetical protein PGTG_21842 [Puccinia graminis f. sp. tritici CRL 75-36-700-3]
MHQWNIQVQFNFSEVRNTSTHVNVNAQAHVQGDTISPKNELTYGKYAVIIKDKNMYIGKILAAYEHFQVNTNELLALLAKPSSLTFQSSSSYIDLASHWPPDFTTHLLILKFLRTLK